MKPEDYHIAIVGPYSYQPFRSITQLANLLQTAFKGMGCETSLHTPPGAMGELTQGSGVLHKMVSSFERMSFSPGLFSARMGKLRSQLAKKKKQLLIVIADQTLSPLNFSLAGFKVLQIVNDMIAVRASLGEFGETSPWGTRFNQRTILSGLSNATKFMAFSQASKDDLCRLIPSVRDENVSVCGQPLVYPYAPMEAADLSDAQAKLWRRFNLMPQDYILHVGSSAWYKNRPGLVRLMGELSKINSVMPKLAFAGAAPTPGELELAQRYDIEIYHFANPSDEELNALYCGARACVLPSFAEGFCWPALEALSCGCPLVVSATPCLAEHFGDASAIVLPDPSNTDPDEWVAEGLPFFQELLDADDANINALIENGLQVAATFTLKRYQNTLSEFLEETQS